MEKQEDFEELFELLNRHSVKYIIVGGQLPHIGEYSIMSPEYR